jgi:hypothetical protein
MLSHKYTVTVEIFQNIAGISYSDERIRSYEHFNLRKFQNRMTDVK